MQPWSSFTWRSSSAFVTSLLLRLPRRARCGQGEGVGGGKEVMLCRTPPSPTPPLLSSHLSTPPPAWQSAFLEGALTAPIVGHAHRQHGAVASNCRRLPWLVFSLPHTLECAGFGREGRAGEAG